MVKPYPQNHGSSVVFFVREFVDSLYARYDFSKYPSPIFVNSGTGRVENIIYYILYILYIICACSLLKNWGGIAPKPSHGRGAGAGLRSDHK